MSFRVAGARDCRSCRKWAKREGFVAIPKTIAAVGHLKRICKDAFSVAGAVQRHVHEMIGGQGADFLRGDAFWSIRSVRWFCVTGTASYDLASIFRGRRSTLERWNRKIAKRMGTRLSELHSIFHFEGSLAKLFCFWCCQVQKLKKSRRIALFWMLSSAKNEEVSQNCFVLDVVTFKN